jgi:hypothetical protein
MEGAHRHEIKVSACGWRAHTDTKEKLVVCTQAKLGWGKGEGNEQVLKRRA